jgi:hypothetical protein
MSGEPRRVGGRPTVAHPKKPYRFKIDDPLKEETERLAALVARMEDRPVNVSDYIREALAEKNARIRDLIDQARRLAAAQDGATP